MNKRFDDASRDPIQLAKRIATMISYGKAKREIIDDLLKEGFSNEEIFLAYGAARVMIKDACGYCGSMDGFVQNSEGWDACVNCGGV